MISYYTLTKQLYNHLISDEDINTVVIGGLDDVDIDKQTLFPLGHILVTQATPLNGFVRFNVAVSCMDIIDLNNNDTTNDWEGEDNKQQMLNTMLAVCENTIRNIRKGSMLDAGFELIGTPTCTPFEDRFSNLLTGWTLGLTIDVPLTVQNC